MTFKIQQNRIILIYKWCLKSPFNISQQYVSIICYYYSVAFRRDFNYYFRIEIWPKVSWRIWTYIMFACNTYNIGCNCCMQVRTRKQRDNNVHGKTFEKRQRLICYKILSQFYHNNVYRLWILIMIEKQTNVIQLCSVVGALFIIYYSYNNIDFHDVWDSRAFAE